MDLVFGDIYLITNTVNGKQYVGQTRCKNGGYIGRWKDHIYSSFMRNKSNGKINKAIRKYGADSFKVELICRIYFETIPECAKKLDELEIKYIKEYETYTKGYNSTKGGRFATFKDGIENLCKSVTQFNTDGTVVAIFDSVLDAERKTGITAISACCRKISKTAGGFIWRFTSDGTCLNNKEINEILIARKVKQAVRVSQYSSSGEFIKTFDSFNKAAACVGSCSSTIASCVSGKFNYACGFIWVREGDIESLNLKLECIRMDCLGIASRRKNIRSIYQYTFDKYLVGIYNSTTEVELRTGFKKNMIADCLSGFRKSHNGYIWSNNTLN